MDSRVEQVMAKVEEFEGLIPWLYKDSAGEVKVGGARLVNAESALRLPFQIGTRAANPEEIAAEFERVRKLEKGWSAEPYRRSGGPELEPAVMSALLRTALAGVEGELRREMPGFKHMPGNVRTALLDMAYDLGVVALRVEYGQMIEALARGEWVEAGALCFRPRSTAARNRWTRQMLLGGRVVDAHGPGERWTDIAYGLLGAGLALAKWLERQGTTSGVQSPTTTQL